MECILVVYLCWFSKRNKLINNSDKVVKSLKAVGGGKRFFSNTQKDVIGYSERPKETTPNFFSWTIRPPGEPSRGLIFLFIWLDNGQYNSM